MVRRDLAANFSRLNVKGMLYQLYVLTNGLSLHLFGKQFPSPLDGHYESFQTSRSITRALRAAGVEEIEIRRGDFFVVTARKAPAP